MSNISKMSKVVNGGGSDARLGIVGKLVAELDSRGLRYCHWKSNEHLLPAVAGDTDLDVLFDEHTSEEAIEALKACGFAPFQAVWFRRYPYIEDFLGIDEATGKLVHVHTHFRLLLGETGVKSFRLPWEDELLDTRCWDQAAGFYTAEPTRELLLLLVRAAIKHVYPAPLQWLRKHKIVDSMTDDYREFYWLKKRVYIEELTELAARFLGPDAGPVIQELYDTGPAAGGLSRLFTAFRHRLDSYRRYSRGSAFVVRWIRVLPMILLRGTRRLGLGVWPSHRTCIGDGLIIAVLGPDGSGKSTQTGIIRSILSAKIDVLPLYMGSGDGPSSVVRAPLILVKKLIKKLLYKGKQVRSTNLAESIKKPGINIISPLTAVWNILWPTTVAWEKKAKVTRAAKAKARGMFVICDRYPQQEIQGYNDGPLLQGYATSQFAPLRWLARWELGCFSHIQKVPPDLVIKLLGDPEVLHSRRPEMTREQIVEKQEGIRAIQFSGQTKVIEINAALPMNAVTIQIMSAVNSRIFEQVQCAGSSSDVRVVTSAEP